MSGMKLDIHQYVVLSIFEDKIVVSSSKLDGIVVVSFFWDDITDCTF